MNVLMISMDATLLTGAIGDSRARHEEYARRAGALSIVVCNRGQLDPLRADPLQIAPTNSRSRLAYLPDGCRVGRALAENYRPDVITSQDPFITGLIGLRLRRVLNAPLIVQDVTSVIENHEFARESTFNGLLQRLARVVVRRADAVRVLNRGEAAACIRLGVPPDRVRVIPIPTDLARFVPPEPGIDWRARLGLKPEDRVALWVGRAVYVKNLPMLLESFARVHQRMPEARLILAGDLSGTSIPMLISLSDLQAVVKTPGAVSHADLPSLYRAADVYAHSSRYEGFGLVLVEAAASGLPLISVETDGARDIIRAGESGLLVPPNAEALANAIQQLLEDPARAKAMGERARADVLERFDTETIIEQWVSMWRDVANYRRAH